MKSICRLVVALLALCGFSIAGADIYRWVDAAGTVHFGNRPPDNAQDVKVVFQEIPSRTPAGAQAGPEQPSAEAVVQEFEEERQRAAEQAEETNQTTPPSRDEMIARERERIEKRIRELEQMPLEQFGSQRNKRARIGFYEYRLQDLTKDPDNYFKNPVTFEGNVLPLPENASTN